MANNSNEEFLVARMVGRVSVDLKQVTERTLRLRSYSFAEVCQETFGTPKETFDSKLITTLFRGDEEDHVRLLHYITREVALAQRSFLFSFLFPWFFALFLLGNLLQRTNNPHHHQIISEISCLVQLH